MANLSQLASDENNREFSGARNPDDLLTVRFFEDAQHNEFASKSEGRPVFETVIMISITTPGMALINEIHRKKVPDDEIRFPRQWKLFEMTNSNDPEKMGTPLSHWPIMKTANVAMLKAVGFHTVDQLAGASDEALSRIGMHGGMDAHALRKAAQTFLAVSKDAAFAQRQTDELQKRDDEMKAMQEAHKKEMEELRSMILASQKAPEPKPAANEPVRRKRRTKAEMEQARA